MAIFDRSRSNLDTVSLFTPESFPAAHGGIGRMKFGRVGRGRMMVGKVGRAMQIGDAVDDLFDWGSAPSDPAATGGASSWGWQSLIDSAAQIYAVKTQADLQKLNIQRAQAGLAPIPPSAVAPQVNVGMAADTQRTLLYLGLGVAGIVAVGFATGMIGGRRRR